MENPMDRLLTRREAAAYLTDLGLKTAPATLAKLACRGGSPAMIVFGRKPLYRPSDLHSWAAARCKRRKSTSDPGEACTPHHWAESFQS
jgi:hypothetical protein